MANIKAIQEVMAGLQHFTDANTALLDEFEKLDTAITNYLATMRSRAQPVSQNSSADAQIRAQYIAQTAMDVSNLRAALLSAILNAGKTTGEAMNASRIARIARGSIVN